MTRDFVPFEDAHPDPHALDYAELKIENRRLQARVNDLQHENAQLSKANTHMAAEFKARPVKRRFWK